MERRHGVRCTPWRRRLVALPADRAIPYPGRKKNAAKFAAFLFPARRPEKRFQ